MSHRIGSPAGSRACIAGTKCARSYCFPPSPVISLPRFISASAAASPGLSEDLASRYRHGGPSAQWGMEALRRLFDAERDELFGRLSGVEVREEDVQALLRRDPRAALRRMGLGRSAWTVMGLGWATIHALSRGQWSPP